MTMFAKQHTEAETPEQADYRRRLIRDMVFEIIPLKSVDDAITGLPAGSTVSVTCSPVKGIDTTLALCEQVQAAGHLPVPHLAARMVDGPAQARSIASWLRAQGLTSVFLVGGDADPPAHYDNATDFLVDLLDADPGLTEIGITAYPDGHAVIDRGLLSEALHGKQQILAEAGVNGYASTQMCFDPDAIVTWLESERANGCTLPIKLGLPGVLDRTKLMTMGTRLGIGASLGYLRKNRKALSKLLTRTDYDPDDLLVPLSPHLQRLDVTALHCFTFNQVARTDEWRIAAGT